MLLRLRARLDRDADRRVRLLKRAALGEPSLQRNDDRVHVRNRLVVRHKRPVVLDEALAAPQRHQMSAPASSGPT